MKCSCIYVQKEQCVVPKLNLIYVEWIARI